MEANIKTPEEIDNLKRAWLHDGIWDIEETEGFEAHREELKAWREEIERQWEEKEKQRLKERATKLGIPDRIDLIRYFESLEYKIEKLQESIERLEDGH